MSNTQKPLLHILKDIIIGDDTIENLESMLPDNYEINSYSDVDTISIELHSVDELEDFLSITESYDMWIDVSNDEYYYHDAVEIFNDGFYLDYLGEENIKRLIDLIDTYFDRNLEPLRNHEIDFHNELVSLKGYLGDFMNQLLDQYAAAYDEYMTLNYMVTINKQKEKVFKDLYYHLGLELIHPHSFEIEIPKLMLSLSVHKPNAECVSELFDVGFYYNIVNDLSYSHELRYNIDESDENNHVIKYFKDKTAPKLLSDLEEYLQDSVDERRDMKRVNELGEKFNFDPFINQTQKINTPNKSIIYKGYNPKDGTHMVGLQQDDATSTNTKTTPISTERLVQLLTNYQLPGIFNESYIINRSFI